MNESEVYYEILVNFVQEKAACEVESDYIISVIHDLIRCKD